MTLFRCGHIKEGNETSRGTCLSCHNAYHRNYRRENLESVGLIKRRYRLANLEECRKGARIRQSIRVKNNPRKYQDIKRRHQYGPNAVEHYEKQLRRQKGLCCLCAQKMKIPCQDHDHKCCEPVGRHSTCCGKCLRGLLCHVCNRRLGYFEWLLLQIPNLVVPKHLKQREWFIKASRYLNYWRKKNDIHD